MLLSRGEIWGCEEYIYKRTKQKKNEMKKENRGKKKLLRVTERKKMKNSNKKKEENEEGNIKECYKNEIVNAILDYVRNKDQYLFK